MADAASAVLPASTPVAEPVMPAVTRHSQFGTGLGIASEIAAAADGTENRESKFANVWSWIATRWSRTASFVTAGIVVVTALGWVVVANRDSIRGSIQGASAAMFSAGSEALAPPTTGTAVFSSTPSEAQVLVDGKELGSTPLTTELPPGHYAIEFRRGGDVRLREIDVTAGQSVTQDIDWNAPRTGDLFIDTMPQGATVVIGGLERGVTPLLLENYPVGSHELLLRGPSGTVRRYVSVTADRRTEVSEDIFSGWVHVSAPFEVVITQAGRRLLLDDRNQVMLPPGVHQLTLVNEALGFKAERQVAITPGGTTQLLIGENNTALTVTATEPSEVLVNGDRIGESPVEGHMLPLGTHQIVVRSLSTGAERQFTVTATSDPLAINADFSAP
jgi:hypothetical protein